MQNLKIVFLFCFGLLLGGQAFGFEVKMKSLSFEPKEAVITQGQSVTWKNVAYTDHSATSNETPPAFETGLIPPGKESKSIEFKTAGTFNYHCSVHGKTMSGVVTVKAK